MTSSVESTFGSYHMTRGVILNNQLTDFSAVPTDGSGAPIANRVAAGKRPRSSMAPTLVFQRSAAEVARGRGSQRARRADHRRARPEVVRVEHHRRAATGQRHEVGVGDVLVAIGVGQALGLDDQVDTGHGGLAAVAVDPRWRIAG